MIHYKGEKVWGSFLVLAGVKKRGDRPVRIFDAHIGTLIDPEVANYHSVYHESEGEQFDGVRGELSYSPMEGLTLPPIEVKEVIWL
ncbi:hypothetical protein [Pseudomonas sp. 5P_3.1_Bac2]|uniref:hypothetical protein n=1 Tax=Pseudomonas sp. 5P_3.1_Bac2 TaxID=2971617 RepID=UPI0021C96C7E|nr:hypothetical protein [Pseudomonas sp. 5P_3.1_Bac2]MCU1718612.1 hypothetical protein [Pseudomonas sp. 5P_3.1_Bac2]